ncbi:conserved Plasmodium protein, unknown function [Plasmodium sp. gorilla clade G2]|uniref:conserved Plasmodium protein, unknown function n=1 Tax=Plasmodium sp. gorilla clade G2 TaxID=880535 RepID=UPI000D202151|nr:conserved Plasmodium protein, unknown function [Plasmodium sp. gorilla clade G2]SOV19945.1 conserved Plasmodium protein, unknown function [Plasmodium sp. gorilla clade G2]
MYDYEGYKRLIVKIAFIASTMTFCFSLLLYIVISLIPQRQNENYADVNLNTEEDNIIITYLYLEKETSSSMLSKEKKNEEVTSNEDFIEDSKTNEMEQKDNNIKTEEDINNHLN